jgi:hypothetical protein
MLHSRLTCYGSFAVKAPYEEIQGISDSLKLSRRQRGAKCPQKGPVAVSDHFMVCFLHKPGFGYAKIVILNLFLLFFEPHRKTVLIKRVKNCSAEAVRITEKAQDTILYYLKDTPIPALTTL